MSCVMQRSWRSGWGLSRPCLPFGTSLSALLWLFCWTSCCRHALTPRHAAFESSSSLLPARDLLCHAFTPELLQVTAFVALLALDSERIAQCRLDVAPCIQLPSNLVLSADSLSEGARGPTETAPPAPPEDGVPLSSSVAARSSDSEDGGGQGVALPSEHI
jgi:hypothetical protein